MIFKNNTSKNASFLLQTPVYPDTQTIISHSISKKQTRANIKYFQNNFQKSLKTNDFFPLCDKVIFNNTTNIIDFILIQAFILFQIRR